VEEGWGYALGLHVNEGEGEQPARKKARCNNTLTSAQQEGCKCGATDHQRVSSKNGPWKGLEKKHVLERYEKCME
jgi:hypothetical protein